MGDCVLIKEEIVIDPMAKSSWVEIADYALEQKKLAARVLPPFDKAVDESEHHEIQIHAMPRSSQCPTRPLAVESRGKYFAQPQDQITMKMNYGN
ncbi:MAG: hypothetical protein ACLU4N_00315 [Butyricimonas faecihominis]